MHLPAVALEDGNCFTPRFDGDPNYLCANAHDLMCIGDGRFNNDHVPKGYTCAHRYSYKWQIVTETPKEGS